MKKSNVLKIFVLCFIFSLLVVLLPITLKNTNVKKIKANVTLGSNEAMFIVGYDFNKKIKQLAGDDNAFFASENDNIKQIKKSSTISVANKTNNNIVSTSSSPKKIYAWYSNGTIYWYTDASKVYMNEIGQDMFNSLTKLESIPEFNQIYTNYTYSMSNMFLNCQSLKSIDLSNINTNIVTSMEYMFGSCYELTSINLSKFNTSQVTNMEHMFWNCRKLASLNLSNFNTSNVTNMYGMFSDCANLTSLNISSFNTSNVTNMQGMFENCKKLVSLNLSNFTTSKVTNMSWMFHNCEKITILDLSSFDTSKVTNMSYMFGWNDNLEKIFVSQKFNISNVSTSTEMFDYCTKLVGGNGTTYNSSYTDKTYARMDKIGEPGYFTGPTITVKYNINYGEEKTATQTFKYGQNNKFGYNIDGTPKWEQTGQFGQWDRTGYVLLGWSMDTKATSSSWGVYSNVTDSWIIDVYNNKTGNTPNQTINLYAVWSPKKITVEFNKNFGTSDPVEQEFTYGAKNNKFGYNTDGTPRWEQTGQFGKWDREGYTLLGWSTDSNATKETYSVYSNVTNNWINTMYDKSNHKISLYAVWLQDGIDISSLIIQQGKVILTKNSTKKTITDIIGTTGIKVLSNNVEITDNTTILKTGDILNVNNTNYPIIILGDVDLNGEINVTDIVGIRKRIKQGPSTFTEIQLIAADYNQDEYINVTDIVGLRKLIKGN